MPERIAVVGIGNILMGDDGVGVAVIEALRRETLPDSVELYDAGTALPDVLAVIGSADRTIFVDSCRSGGEPGSVIRSLLGPEDWRSEPLGDSLHDIGVAHAVQMHCLAGGNLGEIVVIGIEPLDVAPREGLSPALAARVPAVIEIVRRELSADDRTDGGRLVQPTPSEKRRGERE